MINNWYDVTLKDFFAIRAIMEGKSSDTEKTIDLLKYCSDVPDFENKTLKELQGKLPELSFLQKEMPAVNVGYEVELNGERYRIANNSTMVALQFIDFQQALKIEDKEGEDFYCAAIASMLCKEGKLYSDGGRPSKEQILQMKAVTAFSLFAFFLPKSVRLLKGMDVCFQAQTRTRVSMPSLAVRVIFTADLDG